MKSLFAIESVPPFEVTVATPVEFGFDVQ